MLFARVIPDHTPTPHTDYTWHTHKPPRERVNFGRYAQATFVTDAAWSTVYNEGTMYHPGKYVARQDMLLPGVQVRSQLWRECQPSSRQWQRPFRYLQKKKFVAHSSLPDGKKWAEISDYSRLNWRLGHSVYSSRSRRWRPTKKGVT